MFQADLIVNEPQAADDRSASQPARQLDHATGRDRPPCRQGHTAGLDPEHQTRIGVCGRHPRADFESHCLQVNRRARDTRRQTPIELGPRACQNDAPPTAGRNRCARAAQTVDGDRAVPDRCLVASPGEPQGGDQRGEGAVITGHRESPSPRARFRIEPELEPGLVEDTPLPDHFGVEERDHRFKRLAKLVGVAR